jgi:hypothetical protein
LSQHCQNDVKINAKHGFEDNIEYIGEAKQQYGDKIAVLGGMDVDFLCRSEESATHKRIRETVDACPSGTYPVYFVIPINRDLRRDMLFEGPNMSIDPCIYAGDIRPHPYID